MKEWISTTEAAALLHYISNAGCIKALKAHGVDFREDISARGTRQYVWRADQVAAAAKEQAKGDRGVRRKNVVEAGIIRSLNGVLSAPEPPIAQAIRELFAHFPDVARIEGSRVSGDIAFSYLTHETARL